MSSVTASWPPLSEKIAEAIRNDKSDQLARLSPYAACLNPLLTALGFRATRRDVLECLPHFASHLDLIDLRNMLVHLGYESDPLETELKKINPDLLPCLYVSAKKEVFVITERNGKEFLYYDAQKDQTLTGKLPARNGTAYVFTNTSNGHAVANQTNPNWFDDLLIRFRSLIKHLVAMTCLLNIIALIIPLFIMTVYDKIIGARNLDALPDFAAGITLVLVTEFAIRLLRARTLGLVAGRIDYIIGVETFKQVISLPPMMTERSSIAAQLSKLRQFDSVRDFFTGSTASLLLEAPFVILFIAVLGILGGWMALIPATMLLLYFVFAWFWFPVMKKNIQHAGVAKTNLENIYLQTFSAMKELKALATEVIWRERFRESAADAMMASMKSANAQAVLQSVTNSIMMLAGVAVLAMGTMQVMDGNMTVGALIAVMALVWRVLGPFQGLFLAYSRFEHIKRGVKTINQLMSLKVEKQSVNSALLTPEVHGDITFDRVSFRYGPNSDPALIAVSFHLAPKEFLAITGDNGSGKSTVLKLLCGLYAAQSGSVSIDNSDTRQFDANDLRRLIAYVPQQPQLFHGTIAQNLRLKNINATVADITAAAKQAGILEQVKALPRGFNTWVGDNTTDTLPSGLIRGICLARAFVNHSPIILLDEPGCSLDMESDEMFMSQLKKLKGTATIIMISHRPSHIRLADKVVVLNRGMIQKAGTPQEVLNLE